MPGTNGATTTAPMICRVAEADAKDVGRAFARLTRAQMGSLGVRSGDTLEVAGERSTVCRVMPARGDGTDRVHLDGVTRQNAGAAIDEKVTLRPTACAQAQRVALAPTGAAPSKQDLGYLASLLYGLPVTPGDTVRLNLFGSRPIAFAIDRTTPDGPVLIAPETVLDITGNTPRASTPAAAPSYEDIGGLGNQIRRIREMIEIPLRHPEVFERLGIDPPRGVLLHGPPGCGKTLIARTIAHEADASFFTVSGPEIVHKFYGESEAHLRKIWDEARKRAPSIIFLDEVDAIAPSRESTQGEVEKRIVAQLLALMDGLDKKHGLMVIAATNLPDRIDPALRRPGRFDREIEIAIPDVRGRREILDVHSRGMPLATTGERAVDLDHTAAVTHGYVGADLEALCREAAMSCLRGVVHDADLDRGIPYEVVRTLEVDAAHFRDAMHEIQPSALREVFVEVPSVRWSDVGGLDDVKSRLVEAVEWPLKHPEVFQKGGVRPPKGVLLCGPPGVGKTLLAKAVATETQANFISVKGPELISKFVGESEKGVREVFKKARRASPCIVFFDEIDAIAPTRGSGAGGEGTAERVLAQLLTELDGVEELNGVLVLAATNRRDMLDPALLRPGRFDEVVDIGAPDARARREILEVHLRSRPKTDDVDIASVAAATDGASGAQLRGICDRAARSAVRRAVNAAVGTGDPSPAHADPCITHDDLVAAARVELEDNR
jgi:transitional endoplasmic reticulum ATPase